MKKVILNRIKDLAKANFNVYSSEYTLTNNVASDEVSMRVKDLAISYFDNREDCEVERDVEAGITAIDYVDAVCQAFCDFIAE